MSELSNFQKQFLASSGHVEVFTQKEFDDALRLAQAEIMTVAIETTKQAIFIERDECAKIVEALATEENEGELCTALKNAAEAIRNRIPTQRQ
jgi:SOS-response transcriptional repressor LexA